MAIDKWIAAVFLTISIAYGYSAFTYPLLPFEKFMVFRPNSLPMVLSVIGALLSAVILLSSSKTNTEEDVLGSVNIAKWRSYKIGQAAGLLSAMILYALLLRHLGFLGATVLFLVSAGWILGERKLHLMTPIAVIGAGFIWYIVQELLGIFLRPLPWIFYMGG